MKENPEFIGRHYDEEEKKSLKKALQYWSEKSIEPIEGEIEKDQEEIKMIETINSLVETELRSLEIDDYKPISLEKVHILSGKVFEKKFPDFDGKAFFRSTDDTVYINKDKTDTKARVFSTLLHEFIHRASTQKFYANKESGGVHDARVGYRIRSPWKRPERENRLQGFNEVMTDYTVYKILLKNQQQLETDLGITKQDIQGSIYSYMGYGPILESIIKKIAKDKGVPPGEVFDEFEKGQFQPSILVLRDVERSFGKGALEILSYLETLEKSEDNEHLEKMIKEYFSQADEIERQNIQSRIREFFVVKNVSTKTSSE